MRWENLATLLLKPSHVLDKRNRSILLSSKNIFFLIAILAVELLEDVF